MLAEAMFVHGLDRRIAFTVLGAPSVGPSAGRILDGLRRVVNGHVDVDQQHRDDGDDVSRSAVDRAHLAAHPEGRVRTSGDSPRR